MAGALNSVFSGESSGGGEKTGTNVVYSSKNSPKAGVFSFICLFLPRVLHVCLALWGGGRSGDPQKQEECRFRANTHIYPSFSFKSDNPHKMKGDSHCSLIPVSCCGPAVHLVPGGERQVHLMLPHTASLTEAQTRVRASPMLIRKVPHQKSMSV